METSCLIHSIAEKGSSRKIGFGLAPFSETEQA
jgi:hypothetical protein